jgi:hypothetical protein
MDLIYQVHVFNKGADVVIMSSIRPVKFHNEMPTKRCL